MLKLGRFFPKKPNRTTSNTWTWPEAKVITKFFPSDNYYNPPLFWLIQKWIFFAGFGNIVPKYFKDVCFACYTHLSESRFKNNTDYSLVLLAFVGLALVSSIFCSMNNVLEQYGVSARVVWSLRKENAKKSSEEKSSNNNEQLPCNGKEIMTEAYSDGRKGDLNNSLLKRGDSTKQDDVPISGFGRNSFAKETTMKSKKCGSSISLEIFTC